MEKIKPDTCDQYIKAIMNISQAITSDLYLEDILKLIVMVTAKVTGFNICSLWLIDESESPKKISLCVYFYLKSFCIRLRTLACRAC